MAKYRPQRLTHLFLRKKIKEPGRFSDGPASNGLYALATLQHGKLVIYFDQKIRIRGNVTTLRLGKFPDMSLKEARRKAEENVRAVAERRDPRKPSDITFKTIAMEYIDWCALGGTWSPGGRSRQTWINSLTTYAFAVIGPMHPRDIASIHIFEILKEIWITKHKTAVDLGGRISKIMKYAIALGHCDTDPAQIALDGMVPVHVVTKHRRYVHYKHLGEALRIVAASDADPIAVNALIFAALTGVRSGELRKATRDQFNIEERRWHIPAANVKNRRDHFVPLCDVAIAVLEDTFERTGPDSEWVFPAPRGGMMHSDNLKKLLRDCGLDTDVHGFRSSFRTWAAENKIDDTAAEAVLAHKEPNPYIRTTLYKARIAIMDKWAKYLNIWPLPSRKGKNTPPNSQNPTLGRN